MPYGRKRAGEGTGAEEEIFTRAMSALEAVTNQQEFERVITSYNPLIPDDRLGDWDAALTGKKRDLKEIETKETKQAWRREAIFGKSMEKPEVMHTKNGTIAFVTNKGVGYDHNEDAIVIDALHEGFSVIDGIGGSENGEKAARIMAEHAMRGFVSNEGFRQTQALAGEEIDRSDLDGGGACYASVRVEGNLLKGAMAGDVRIMVIRGDQVVFKTRDEGSPYWENRREVYNYVDKNGGDTTEFEFALEAGDVVIGGSDGLFDNFDNKVFSTDENAYVKDADAGNLDIARLIVLKSTAESASILNREIVRRMTEYQTEGDKTTYKPDNYSFFVYKFMVEEKPEPVNEEAETGDEAPEASRLKMEELESLSWWQELSEGQKKLALKNLDQVIYGLAIEQSTEKTGRAMAETKNYLKKAWLGMTHSYQVMKAKGEAHTAIIMNREKIKALLEQIAEGIKSAGVDAEVNPEGKLEILFAEDLKSLVSKEKQGDINVLNHAATEFSKVPYEWGLDSATNAQRKKYDKAEHDYYQTLGRVKEGLKTDYPTISVKLDLINERIHTQQLINNHPELDTELRNIRSPKFWRTVAEKGAYFGMGFFNKSLFGLAIGTAGAPIAAAFMAGVLGRERAHGRIRAAQMESRRGKSKLPQASDYHFVNFDGKIHVEPRKESGQIVDRLAKAGALADGLRRLQQKVENGSAPAQALVTSVAYTRDMLEKGLLDFGASEERITNQYKLLESLSRAGAISELYQTSELAEVGDKGIKMAESTENRLNKLYKQQVRYLNRETIKAAGLGATFTLIGQAVRWFWPHAEGGQVAHEAVAHQTPAHTPVQVDTPMQELTPAPRNVAHAQGVTRPGVAGRMPRFVPEPTHESAVPSATTSPINEPTHTAAPTTQTEATLVAHASEHVAEIREGGSAWAAARELAKQNNLSNKEFYRAWANPESQVVLPDGRCVPLADLDLTHEGDQITYVEGADGHAGHFEFRSTSGLRADTELPVHHDETPTLRAETTVTNEEVIPPSIRQPIVATHEPEHIVENLTAPEQTIAPAHTPWYVTYEHLKTRSGYALSRSEVILIKEYKIKLEDYDLLRRHKTKVSDFLREIPPNYREALAKWANGKVRLPHSMFDIDHPRSANPDNYNRVEFDEHFRIASVIRKMTGVNEAKKLGKAIGKLTLDKFFRRGS